METLREDLAKKKKFYSDCIAATDAFIKARERKIAEIADLENKRKVRNKIVVTNSSRTTVFCLSFLQHRFVFISLCLQSAIWQFFSDQSLPNPNSCMC